MMGPMMKKRDGRTDDDTRTAGRTNTVFLRALHNRPLRGKNNMIGSGGNIGNGILKKMRSPCYRYLCRYHPLQNENELSGYPIPLETLFSKGLKL